MKLWISFLALLCLVTFSRADGFPFYVNGEVIGANIRLPLNEEQSRQVAATGRVDFTGDQLKLLRVHYSSIPVRLRVISTTYNDSREDVETNSVDCLWTAPTEIAITLPTRQGKSEFAFDDGVDTGNEPDLRISPGGTIFHTGKEIKLAEAFELVRSAKPKLDPKEDPTFVVTLPPAFREEDEESAKNNKVVADLHSALRKFGESVGVTVQQIW